MTSDPLDTLADARQRVACVASDLQALANVLDDFNEHSRVGWVAGELRRKAQELGGAS